LIQVKAANLPAIDNEKNDGKPAMQIDNHSLINEFPLYREKIHALKTSSRHFLKLFDEYHAVDKEINRLETEDSPVTDEHMEQLKKKRLQLKDLLHVMLQDN
jgi:uncharacterized protein YdcH (DUF465 family)